MCELSYSAAGWWGPTALPALRAQECMAGNHTLITETGKRNSEIVASSSCPSSVFCPGSLRRDFTEVGKQLSLSTRIDQAIASMVILYGEHSSHGVIRRGVGYDDLTQFVRPVIARDSRWYASRIDDAAQLCGVGRATPARRSRGGRRADRALRRGSAPVDRAYAFRPSAGGGLARWRSGRLRVIGCLPDGALAIPGAVAAATGWDCRATAFRDACTTGRLPPGDCPARAGAAALVPGGRGPYVGPVRPVTGHRCRFRRTDAQPVPPARARSWNAIRPRWRKSCVA